jgi:hypothetical protein
MHLFAYKQPMEIFNIQSLKKINSPSNPVAKLRPLYTKANNPTMRSSARHFVEKGDALPSTFIARGCKVELKGRNISPQIGLFNGAMGTVFDIVYNKNESSHSGHLPRYVLVHFPNYTGPQFITDHANVIPIVPIQKSCFRYCCVRTYMPIQLCYAKTIHTFQGQSAGPVAANQQPNPVQRIVVHIGNRQFEGQNPGLTYTALSRSTSMGNSTDLTTSSLFFDGNDAIPERFVDIARAPKTLQLYKLVYLRNNWVKHLSDNQVHPTIMHQEKDALFRWAENFRPTSAQIKKFSLHFEPISRIIQ